MQAGGRLQGIAPSSPDNLAEVLDASHPLRLDCDVLVNCAGLDGARDLWKDDSVYAVRGQVPAPDRLSDRLCANNLWNYDSVHAVRGQVLAPDRLSDRSSDRLCANDLWNDDSVYASRCQVPVSD